MIYIIIYLVTVLDQLKSTLTLGTTAGVTLLCAMGVCWAISKMAILTELDRERQAIFAVKLGKYSKWTLIAIIALASINALLPSTKTAAIIFAGGQAYEVVTSDAAKEIGGEAIDAIRRMVRDANVESIVKSVKD